MTTSRTAGTRGSGDSRLNAARRLRELEEATDGRVADVLVVGLGATGAGVALDAASRGLSVVAVDAHDIAFGTSRWSSKLAHGGLRYLASLQLGIAHESAVERGILMQHTAPHLTHPTPWLIPLTRSTSHTAAFLDLAAFAAGDVLRRAARTPSALLPPPRRVSRAAALAIAPGLRRDGLRGAVLGWDCRLEDDARLVVAVARTAAAHGARVLTRTRVLSAVRDHAEIRDELTGDTATIRAKVVVNATGVWAGDLTPDVHLRPSRGTHLVVRSSSLGAANAVVNAAIPGTTGRFVFTLPQSDGLTYIGLTDEAVEGHPDDVPAPGDHDIDFLLDTINTVLERPLERSDVVGVYAGLRPLIDAEGASADLSRRHAVLTSPDGVVTIVGGKLTTYRRMAQDVVDHVVQQQGLHAGRCVTAGLPLIGAADRAALGRVHAPPRLVRRYGTEAPTVAADVTPAMLEPIASTVPTTPAELRFAVTHEGALDVDDLLDRRTRIGLVPADRALALTAAHDALAH